MGIPSFYRWLIENFPKVLENNLNGEIKFNNLYIDMNGVVHNAIKLDHSPTSSSSSSSTTTTPPTTPTTTYSKDKEVVLMLKSELSDEKLKERIFYRLDQMVNNVNPSSLLYIGVDGVPPRAKAIEQRKRRFKSSKETVDVIIKQLKSKSKPITRDSIIEQFSLIFDSNSISPATEFIEKVDDWIKDYCKQLSLKRQNLSIILSDSTVPGEGEHKIMDYIRQNHPILKKDGMSHCFYGMDADLIFLGLESHLSNFYILRDPISLISCSTCKANDDHSNYECRSAIALKKQFQKKSTSVIVRGIPNQCSENDIKQLFSYYGNIKIEKIEKSNTKNKTLNAYIEFENEDIVNEVSTRGSTFTINNERVSIHVEYLDDIFKPKNEKGEIIKDEDEELAEQENPSTEKANQQLLTAEEIAKKQKEEPIPENAVFIVGLDSAVSKFDIITFFEKFGKISSFQLSPSPRFNKQQFVMIKYETQESARLACKSTDIEFFGTIITIKRAQLPKTESNTTINSNGSSKTPPLTEEEKQAKEKVKEKKRIIKDSKIQQVLAKFDPNTPKDVAIFYLGLSSWNVNRAFENYLLFNKAGLEHTILNNTTDNDNNNSNGSGSGKKKKILFDYVNIDSFRTYLEYYFFEKIEKSKREKINFNRVINDFTVLCFYLGNDFLPHLPSVGIQSGSIELIMCWYREWIQNCLNGDDDIKYIVNEQSTHLNFENCLPLLESLADWESSLYPENLEKQVKKDFIKVNKNSTSNESSSIVMVPPEFKYDDLLYYRVKFDLIGKPDDQVKKLVDDMCYQYTLGLHWVLRYYVSGCQAWDWYYPYHYAPLAKDLLNYQKRLSKIQDREMVNNQFNFKLSSPLPPLIHLASVLPRNSVAFLPDSMKHIVNENSPFTASYRDDYKYDFNGENVAWKAIVLLDFMDIEKFKEYLLPIVNNELTDNEKKRNLIGNDIKFKNGEIIQLSPLCNNTTTNNNNNNYEEKEIPCINITKNLSIKDLSYPTRNYFTRSSHPVIDSNYISIPTQQASTVDHNQLVPLTKEQADFLQWRKSKTGFNQSLEILQSIDFSKCGCVNIDKKQISQFSGSGAATATITCWLGRVLNNEISSDSTIFIQSIDDSQLIINIGFKQAVKLTSIKFVSSSNRVPDRDSVPKVIKIYTNNDQPNIDFSVIESLTPKCTIEFSSPSELESYSSSTPFSFASGTTTTNTNFKSVNNLTIFIESNFSKNQDKVSIIEKIILS
ncbi:hypothetical protein DDB_G0289921 [Dictyostelium discoideum AX4]|uniref:Uncharacterized protein n=1 Tax=Dictyostelium discoideum TaxID=44689 RepID=Q54GU2_DICDI|nr:hypothetical protein DDB_G0289921 [Dictyostelium discoideum AX4]EAL62473.1 hypothetical protein DDB_G0289921 [Dictyostelium discoideum AX4]|eukprot:XP_635977.1 hypothetical protein DDB_G0289921 [Dictyostelium discoideum AX4]